MKRFHFTLTALFSLAAAFAGGCGSSETIPPMPENAVLIDVRGEAEYKAGHLKGAILLPHDTIENTIAAAVPDKKTPLYLYCRSGRRVGIAIEKLKKLDYTTMYNLGGLEEAAEKLGRPVEK